jgi:hypothetical protein
MSEEILKAIKNKKTAFYNWKTNGRIKEIHDPFLTALSLHDWMMV